MTMVNQISNADLPKAGATGLCEGANLRTPCGARRIEFLRRGDLVVTRDNGLQPARLIWTHTVTASEIAADPSLAPIILRPRAIGPMMPQRDLAVGAAHRLLIPGWRLEDEDDGESCLVPARDVAGLNDSAFVDRAPEEVTYFNVVFDEPQVFCANGLPVESFSPSSDNLKNAPRSVREELQGIFPELAPKYANYPAPRYKLRERVSYSPDFA